MPPELLELYNLYQQELETRESNQTDTLLVTEAEKILRVRCVWWLMETSYWGLQFFNSLHEKPR